MERIAYGNVPQTATGRRIRTMAVVGGVITLVQEDRFKLAGDNGEKRQFTLFHRARVGIPDLQELERTRQHVQVSYHPAEAMLADVAETVEADAEPVR